MTLLLLLAACGVDGPLDTPNPPPEPPPMLVNAEPDVVRQSGVVSEVHAPTRSFVLTGEGKRVIAHLRDGGTLRLSGQPAQVADLAAGTVLWVEGKRLGDLLLVVRASDRDKETPAVAAVPADGAAPAEAAAAPDDADAPDDPDAPDAPADAPVAPPAAPSAPG